MTITSPITPDGSDRHDESHARPFARRWRSRRRAVGYASAATIGGLMAAAALVPAGRETSPTPHAARVVTIGPTAAALTDRPDLASSDLTPSALTDRFALQQAINHAVAALDQPSALTDRFAFQQAINHAVAALDQ